jgi:hypothetical protein
MNEIETRYGTLTGISTVDYYKTGEVKECMLNKRNEIKTPYGTYIPQFEQDEVRKRFSKSVSFYKNGNVRSINLHEQSTIQTDYGTFPIELISFYKDESIKRIFPLNGKITGYWTEEDEVTLAKEFKFDLPFGTIEKKIIGLSLYPSGKLKSLTLWPNDEVLIETPVGPLNIRTGFSLYENSELKSCEPKKPTGVLTPIGLIYAFDMNALGIHADDNSLNFTETGDIKSLMTSTDGIEIITPDDEHILIKPELVPNLLDPDIMDTVPVMIEFINHSIRFNEDPALEFLIENHTFTVQHFIHRCLSNCSSCSGCSSCS